MLTMVMIELVKIHDNVRKLFYTKGDLSILMYMYVYLSLFIYFFYHMYVFTVSIPLNCT